MLFQAVLNLAQFSRLIAKTSDATNDSSVRVFGNDSFSALSLSKHVWLNKLNLLDPIVPTDCHIDVEWPITHFCPRSRFSRDNPARTPQSGITLWEKQTYRPSVRPSVTIVGCNLTELNAQCGFEIGSPLPPLAENGANSFSGQNNYFSNQPSFLIGFRLGGRRRRVGGMLVVGWLCIIPEINTFCKIPEINTFLNEYV